MSKAYNIGLQRYKHKKIRVYEKESIPLRKIVKKFFKKTEVYVHGYWLRNSICRSTIKTGHPIAN